MCFEVGETVRPVIAFVGCRVAVTIGFNVGVSIDEGWLGDALGIPVGWLDGCEEGDVAGWLDGCVEGWLVGCEEGGEAFESTTNTSPRIKLLLPSSDPNVSPIAT